MQYCVQSAVLHRNEQREGEVGRHLAKLTRTTENRLGATHSSENSIGDICKVTATLWGEGVLARMFTYKRVCVCTVLHCM